MRIYKLINRTKIASLWLMVTLALAILLIFPSECRNGAANGVYLCIQVLIPSLFPFMIIAGFVSASGISARLPKFITCVTRILFALPDCGSAVIFLSAVGGYPVGATAIKEMYNKGLLTKNQAERMAMYCVASGPGFLLTYIGSVMTRNLKLGYILLASQIISLITLGIIARFTIHPKEAAAKQVCTMSTKQDIKSSFVYSVDRAIKTCSMMCALVVIFSTLSEVFVNLCNGNRNIIWITGLIEVTNGVKILADAYPTTLISFVCGFGGLCVHFQIFAQLKSIGINKCNFYIFRIIQGIICAGTTFILTKIFPITQSVFSSIDNPETKLYTTSVGCVFLILVCVSFIICTRHRRF